MTGTTRSKRSWSGKDTETGRVKRACSDAEAPGSQESPVKGRATRASKAAKRKIADDNKNLPVRFVHVALFSRVNILL